MTISKNDYVFRLRVIFAAAGVPESIDVTNKTQLLEDGKVLSVSDGTTRSIAVNNPVVHAAIEQLLAAINAAYEAEEAERQAAAAKKAADEKVQVDAMLAQAAPAQEDVS